MNPDHLDGTQDGGYVSAGCRLIIFWLLLCCGLFNHILRVHTFFSLFALDKIKKTGTRKWFVCMYFNFIISSIMVSKHA